MWIEHEPDNLAKHAGERALQYPRDRQAQAFGALLLIGIMQKETRLGKIAKPQCTDEALVEQYNTFHSDNDSAWNCNGHWFTLWQIREKCTPENNWEGWDTKQFTKSPGQTSPLNIFSFFLSERPQQYSVFDNKCLQATFPGQYNSEAAENLFEETVKERRLFAQTAQDLLDCRKGGILPTVLAIEVGEYIDGPSPRMLK